MSKRMIKYISLVVLFCFCYSICLYANPEIININSNKLANNSVFTSPDFLSMVDKFIHIDDLIDIPARADVVYDFKELFSGILNSEPEDISILLNRNNPEIFVLGETQIVHLSKKRLYYTDIPLDISTVNHNFGGLYIHILPYGDKVTRFFEDNREQFIYVAGLKEVSYTAREKNEIIERHINRLEEKVRVADGSSFIAYIAALRSLQTKPVEDDLV